MTIPPKKPDDPEKLAAKPSHDTKDIIADQKKNMQALVEANRSAAVSYQQLFTKQLRVFEKTMAEAQTKTTDASPTRQSPQAKIDQTMQDFANSAQNANNEALEKLGEQAQQSFKDFQEYTKSLFEK